MTDLREYPGRWRPVVAKLLMEKWRDQEDVAIRGSLRRGQVRAPITTGVILYGEIPWV